MAELRRGASAGGLYERLLQRLAMALDEADSVSGLAAEQPRELELRDGGTISSSTWGSGPGGQVTVNADLTWRVAPPLKLTASVRYEGQRWEDDLNSRSLGAATTLDLRAEYAFAADWTLRNAAIRHVFTHFELRLSIFRVGPIDRPSVNHGFWVPVTELDGEALPTVMKKAIAAAIPTAFATLKD